MSRFGTQYQISRPTGTCAHTGDTLEPGTTCMATLCEREEDDAFERCDFSLAAWESGARPKRLFSNWRTVVPERGAKQRLLVDDELLVDLFLRLGGETRSQRVAFRFVLALILMRKRLIRFAGRKAAAGDATAAKPPGETPGDTRDARPDSAGEFWLVRLKGSDPDEPPLEVENPRLGDDDVRVLTSQLSEILQGEL